MKPLVNVLETAEQLGATKWAQYIRDSGLAGELEGPGAYTLFAPTNEAFEVSRVGVARRWKHMSGSLKLQILVDIYEYESGSL